VAEIGQNFDDAVVTPAGVVFREADNECLHFGRDAGTAR
jgi:NAD-specific glutamate dehydrogenase